MKVGAWFAMRGIELIVERKFEEQGREVRWYHRLAMWAFPIALWSWAAVHNHGVMR